LSKKSVSTQYGDKEKYNLQFKEKPNQWLDSFVGGWNSDWKIGQQVEISKEQFQSREYEGKTYWTIKAPEGAKGGGGVSWAAHNSLVEQFNQLAERVGALESGLPEEEPEDSNEIFGEEPPAEENAQMDEIPF